MSGIAGAVHLDGRPADPALIGRMARALAHRGPDGESRWVAGPVGLAHRRLAAATPEDKQPFADTDGRVFVWDGRLDQPARFEHAWGEFAVAAWDARSKTLLCARDAFGVKPLYYHWDGRRLLFASEVGALLEAAAVVRRPDASTIADYLLMDFRDPGATFFEGIRRVPPGHVLTVGKRGLSLHRYWRPAASAPGVSEEDHAANFAACLLESVRDRLSDASAAGVLLSGGIDSTLIAAVAGAVRGRDARPLASATFLHEGLLAEDWEAIAFLMAAGAIAPPRTCTNVSILEILTASPEPPNDEGYPVLSVLFDADAAHEFRVLLTGIGGDELSSAAERGAIGDLLGSLRPIRAWREAAALARAYGHDGWRASTDVLRTALPAGPRLAVRRLALRRLPRWLRPRLARARRPWPGEVGGPRFETRMAAASWRALTAPSFTMALEKLDAESAALGIELRHPYLDRRVVECFLATPPAVLVRHGYRKQFVQRALGCRMPLRTIERPGEHVPSPDGAAQLRRDAAMLERGLFRPDARVFDYVDRAEAERMRDAYLARGAPHGARLWSFLLLETWLRRTFTP